MITLEQFRELDLQVSRARGVRSTTSDPSPAALRAYSARAVAKDIADLKERGNRNMAARAKLGLETW